MSRWSIVLENAVSVQTMLNAKATDGVIKLMSYKSADIKDMYAVLEAEDNADLWRQSVTCLCQSTSVLKNHLNDLPNRQDVVNASATSAPNFLQLMKDEILPGLGQAFTRASEVYHAAALGSSTMWKDFVAKDASASCLPFFPVSGAHTVCLLLACKYTCAYVLP